MTIKVLRVLKDYNNNQCAVTALFDGIRYANMPMQEFLRKARANGAVRENFAITSSGVKGKGCNLEYKEFLSSAEIWKRYPDKLVVIEDGIFSPNSVAGRLIRGVVLHVYDKKDKEVCYKRYQYDGIHLVLPTIDPVESLRKMRGGV